MQAFVKKMIIKFRHTIYGRKLWKLAVLSVNSYYIRRLLIKALDVDTHKISEYNTVFPKIHKSKSDKNALIIMPFYGNDAVGKNIDTKIETLRTMGFAIHVIVFNNSSWDSHCKSWDFTYNIKSQSGGFGKLKYDVNNQIIADGNNIDDWVDDEVCQFIAALSSMNKFDIALINYVFLSKLCLFINYSAISIIDTHDVFANRNSRMSKIGVSSEKFYFSTSSKEESKGLSRADYIFAIQESEGEYFRNTVDSEVIVQPPILDINFIQYKASAKSSVIVGFMASGHYPNVIAINNFINSLKELEHNVQLNISGTICGVISEMEYPSFVKVMGFCDSLEGFYSSCDVIVNPDELLSGMKVKCLEAFSFGVPLIATKASMEGINSTECYHQLDSARECALFVSKLSKSELIKMSEKSRDVFTAFNSVYNFNTTLTRVLAKNGKN